MYLYTLASFSILGFLNMQISTASTHSHVDLIGYKVVYDVRNKKYSEMALTCLKAYQKYHIDVHSP